MVLAMVACGSNNAPNNSTTPNNTTGDNTGNGDANTPDDSSTEDLHFVFVSPLLSHPIWLIAKEGFETACEELGIQPLDGYEAIEG